MNFLVLHVIPSLQKGGAESALTKICLKNPQNHKIICLINEGSNGEILRNAGVEIKILGIKRGGYNILSLYQLFKAIKSKKPDIIQTWMYHSDLYAGILAKLSGHKKIVWNIRHTQLSLKTAKKSTILIAKISAKISKHLPNKIIVCAYASAKWHQKFGYDSSKMTVINNGYDFSVFKPCLHTRKKSRLALGINEDQFIVGMVANYKPEKNHSNLINALSEISKSNLSITCLLAGDNLTKKNTVLMKKIRDLHLEKNILLLGSVSDIPEIMNTLDLHVLSSWSEGFPNVLAEAMACGTPCITTDVGDARLIVGDTGWVIPSSDSSALAKSIKSALEERNKYPFAWEERQKLARARVLKKFSIKKMISDYEETWKNLI